MKVTLHPGAERDLPDAAAFYEREGSPALAARCIAEFRRLAALLIEQPEIGARRSRGRRGFAMKIFPYTAIYRLDADEIRSLVVKHNNRRPGYGRKRS